MQMTVRSLADIVASALEAAIEDFNTEHEAMVSMDDAPAEEGGIEISIDGGSEHGLFYVTITEDPDNA